jgi:CelD/BcsL family acetyltransferase involved in cellulose biosynthesis
LHGHFKADMTVAEGLDLPAVEDRAPQSTEKFAFALVADRAGFDALEPEWNALFARAGQAHQLFQTYNWLRHWSDHYLDGRTRLSIVIARQDGRLVMVWPLIAIRRAGLTRLCWMGEPASQYGDVLVEEGPSRFHLLSRGWAYVKSLDADVVHLRKVRADAVVFPLLKETGALTIAAAAAPYLDLARAGDDEACRRRSNSKKRGRRRSLRRRLEELGPVAFEHPECGPAAAELVERALTLKQKWLAARGVVAPVIQDVRFGKFLRAVAAGRTGAAGVRVSAVCCDGAPVAVEVSLECKQHRVAYLISYDVELARYGVGIIVAEHSIETAYRQGLLRFDLLTPADAYKMEWADGCVDVHDWAVPLSPAGRFYARVWLCAVHAWMKSTIKRAPAWLGRGLAGFYRWRQAVAARR